MGATSDSLRHQAVPGDYLAAGAGPGQWRWPLPDRQVVTIGRDPGSDLCLEADDRASRRHAELQRSGGRWWITDRSTNGTFVNDLRVTQQPLHDSDRIRIGSTELTFHSGGARTVIEPPAPSGAAGRTPARKPGLGSRMLVVLVLEVLHLGLNSLATFVTNHASGSMRWIVSQTAVLVIAMVMEAAGAAGEREAAPAAGGARRRGTSGVAAFVVILLVLGVGGYAATQGVRYAVAYTSGKETGTDRLVRPVTTNAAGLTLTVNKVEDTRHFTRVELTVRNNTSSTSITLPLFENCVFSAADGTTLQADSFRSQWSQTIPPGALQRGTITFPGHLSATTTRASLSFSHIFGTFNANAISIRGIPLHS
ncbi:MAG TPA: FHA domain-containing protein [Kribbellaceae bacterium]|nr:FHA domain-containing protein [Kribbellaceae bacterium]